MRSPRLRPLAPSDSPVARANSPSIACCSRSRMAARNGAAPPMRSKAARPRSRKSCSPPNPAACAGPRARCTSARTMGFFTTPSRYCPMRYIRSICRSRSSRRPTVRYASAYRLLGDRASGSARTTSASSSCDRTSSSIARQSAASASGGSNRSIMRSTLSRSRSRARGIARTVELVGEEVDGCPVARIRVQVLVRAEQTPGLPVLQRLEPAREIGLPRNMSRSSALRVSSLCSLPDSMRRRDSPAGDPRNLTR